MFSVSKAKHASFMGPTVMEGGGGGGGNRLPVQ